MNVLVRNTNETIKLQRKTPVVTTTSISWIDVSTGSALSLGSTFSDDTTDETLLNNVSKGANSIECANLDAERKYAFFSSVKSAILEVINVSPGNICEIAPNFPFTSITGDSVKGIETDIIVSIPATYTEKSILLEVEFSDTKISNEYLVANQRLYSPISSEDLYLFWGRLRDMIPYQQEVAGVEYQPQIDYALEQLRGIFWSKGFVLDNLKNNYVVKQLLIYLVGLNLVSSGFDLDGSNDPKSQKEAIQGSISNELSSIFASDVWLDKDENNIKDESETPAVTVKGWGSRCCY